jgi:hypothetical protein
VRITSVDILDSSEQPTGYTVPFADPVDARTAAFSNAGRGTKVAVTDAVLGIVGTKDLADPSTFPIAPVTDLWLKVNNGTTISVSLGGTVDTTDLLNRINSVAFNVAGTLSYAGKTFLTIRSGDSRCCRTLRTLGLASTWLGRTTASSRARVSPIGLRPPTISGLGGT